MCGYDLYLIAYLKFCLVDVRYIGIFEREMKDYEGRFSQKKERKIELQECFQQALFNKFCSLLNCDLWLSFVLTCKGTFIPLLFYSLLKKASLACLFMTISLRWRQYIYVGLWKPKFFGYFLCQPQWLSHVIVSHTPFIIPFTWNICSPIHGAKGIPIHGAKGIPNSQLSKWSKEKKLHGELLVVK